MTGAFNGDPRIRSDLLDRLKAHAARGTLRFGATQWDGQGGSPLGVSVEGGDTADYAARFGYPLALAGVLDPMTALAAPDEAVDHALCWVSCVAPGADLSRVTVWIVEELLLAHGADRLAARYLEELRALYRAESDGQPPARRDWSALRGRIAAAVEDAPALSDTRAAFSACATACWPLRTSRSVLTTLIDAWVRDATRIADTGDAATDRAEALAMLAAIHAETQVLRDAGRDVDIPATFRARAPRLAAVFEARLAHANARYFARARTIPGIVLAQLARASG